MGNITVSRIMLTLFSLGMLVLAFDVVSVSAGSPVFDYCDALVAPDLPLDPVISESPSPGYYESSEYLIGSVAVGIIFLESNGAIDPSTEDWTSTRESWVTSEITSGLSWLAGYNLDASIGFTYAIHYKIPTSYEPISRPHSDQGLWISEAMTYLGYPGPSYFTQVRDYINALRETLGTDWAFTIFVVDSYYDSDGKFSDGYFAYAYLGGPFLVMTYDNNGWGIGNMDRVAAHETGHIFYATDEYDDVAEYSGYLNVQDDDGAFCLMNYNDWTICPATRGQLGWRDTDGDGIQDIVDTFPDVALDPYSPDPTKNPTPTYTGNVTEIPYPNNNPRGTGRDVTINKIVQVEFRVDGGTWQSAASDDGYFDEAEEDYSFATPPLSLGTHTIESRAISSSGNIALSEYDEVTIEGRVHNLNTGLNYTMIQEAIDAPETIDGHTIIAESGAYYENVVVWKSVFLVGENPINTIIDASGSGDATRVIDNLVVFENFTIRHSDIGIKLVGVNNCTIKNNIIVDNQRAIYLSSSNLNNISRNNITTSHSFYADSGIVLDSSSSNTVFENNITGWISAGIFLDSYSEYNVIFGNNVTNDAEWASGIGISSSFNIISGNNVTTGAFGGAGIYIGGCFNNTLSGNEMHIWGLSVEGSTLNHFMHSIDDSNLVHGKSVYYLVNENDLVLDYDTQAGYVALINCTDMTVEGQTLKKNEQGLLLFNTNSSRIMNNTIISNWHGLLLRGSANNTISRNLITSNGLDEGYGGVQLSSSSNNTISENNITNNVDYGISLSSSSENSIYGNNITNNGYGMMPYPGVLLSDSSYNTISGNNVADNAGTGIKLWGSSNYNSISGNNITHSDYGDGIGLFSSSGNTISGNNIANNGWEYQKNGIFFTSSSNNYIYHNNFVNNFNQVSSSDSINLWDDGYPSGGNYWSDHVGVDDYSGPNQDQPGSDRIGDTPRIIDENNRDNYPLMNPVTYLVTIRAGCYTEGVDVEVDIIFMDGWPASYATPHTFGLSGTHTFTVPSIDPHGHRFKEWSTSETSTTLTVSEGGTYTAYYSVHDVAVTDITAHPTGLPQGEPVFINVMVENQGDFTETFDVIVYADQEKHIVGDEIVVGMQTVYDLPPGESQILYFIWDTTGVPYGNYWISSEASVVPGETDTADNILTGAYLGGICRPFQETHIDVFAYLVQITSIILATAALGIAGIGLLKILGSPRLRWPMRRLKSKP